MNVVVAELDARKLIKRAPSAAHRKVLETYLTTRGAKLLAACDKDADELETAMTDPLTAVRVSALRSSITVCIESVTAIGRRTVDARPGTLAERAGILGKNSGDVGQPDRLGRHN